MKGVRHAVADAEELASISRTVVDVAFAASAILHSLYVLKGSFWTFSILEGIVVFERALWLELS